MAKESEKELTGYLAVRVEDLPVPIDKSVKRKCDMCHKEVWVDSRQAEEADSLDVIHCINCAKPDLAALIKPDLQRINQEKSFDNLLKNY